MSQIQRILINQKGQLENKKFTSSPMNTHHKTEIKKIRVNEPKSLKGFFSFFLGILYWLLFQPFVIRQVFSTNPGLDEKKS